MYFMYLIFFLLIFAPRIAQEKTTEVTVDIVHRVEFLKKQIAHQIKQHVPTPVLREAPIELMEPIINNEQYDYVDIDNLPITPIMDNDVRKKDDRFKLPQLKTTTTKWTEWTTPTNISELEFTLKPIKRKRSKKRRKKQFKQARALRTRETTRLDVFYKRNFPTYDVNLAAELHCQDLITPFLSGFKQDFKYRKHVGPSDPTVLRFMQLLHMNITGHTKEELYSILYQVSNLQLRLFHWDVLAIKDLLTSITGHKPHSFRVIKAGVRNLLESWHLDLTNTTNLLKQSRIFRPPCIKTSEYGGSTKKSTGKRWDKPTTQKTTCSEKNNFNTCVPV